MEVHLEQGGCHKSYHMLRYQYVYISSVLIEEHVVFYLYILYTIQFAMDNGESVK